ncbi:uncharacterized protein METZ01_LOCUS505261, partial [marine metagenome]
MIRHWILILKVLLLMGPISAFNAAAAKFNVLETSIADVHRAFTDESLTCLELTQIYLRRIEFYDQSTGLNSIILVNPDATVRATTLDAEFAATGTLKPLHCVPMIIKDNYNVRGLQTTAGSKAMLGFMPEKDAWQIARIREAGALVLGKS